jgi:hypothetical protein
MQFASIDRSHDYEASTVLAATIFSTYRARCERLFCHRSWWIMAWRQRATYISQWQSSTWPENRQQRSQVLGSMSDYRIYPTKAGGKVAWNFVVAFGKGRSILNLWIGIPWDQTRRYRLLLFVCLLFSYLLQSIWSWARVNSFCMRSLLLSKFRKLR